MFLTKSIDVPSGTNSGRRLSSTAVQAFPRRRLDSSDSWTLTRVFMSVSEAFKSIKMTIWSRVIFFQFIWHDWWSISFTCLNVIGLFYSFNHRCVDIVSILVSLWSIHFICLIIIDLLTRSIWLIVIIVFILS